ncbi:hypothetical protein ACB098_10G148800 [Castanea mollissima]|uniref:Uncharacterized protein n=1 Tax=Castanea mollissima TaxID=60419 RepID=A0A8J4VYC1_9ROSI|nr:hypothetical protein CMV_001016 [Castanea mollissima]
MAKLNCFSLLVGKKKKDKGNKESLGNDEHKGQKILQVKIEHPVNSSKSEELALTTFTVEVPYSIPNNSQCSVKVMSHKSPVGDEAVEVAYEGEDEHEENSSMKKNYSDFDLSAQEDLSGDKDSGLGNANADFSYPSDTLVKEQFDDKDSEKGVDMIQTGHISDPGVGKAEFWSSPKLKRSCSNVETRDMLRKTADLYLPPSKSQSFEQLQELSEKVRQNIDPGSPKSVMTHGSADRVMLKKHSSSQVLPSRSRRLWWKLFLWSHRNLHNAWALQSHSLPTRAVLNPQGGYSSDTLEPNQTMELGKMASPGSFTGESLNKGDNNNNNGNKSWNAFQNGTSGLWPQNQWVAFSSDSSPFARVDEWVKGLETQYPLPVIDNYENDEGITFPPSPETGRSPARSPTQLTRQHDINFTEEILHANSVIESLNSSSTVAHISGIGLKAIPIISSFLSLRSVNLSNNFIVQITPGSLPKGLHTLNLSRNKINTVEGLRELTRLRVIDISYNRISRIGHGLSNCTLIKELYVAGNKISDVEGLHRLLKLTVLDLSFNKITTTKALGQLVANYHTLQALNLLGNPIQSNISDDQLRKAVCDLLPKLAYLNKQSIKPQRARELLTDSVAKAALGNRISRKKSGKRVSQSKSSASGHKSSANVVQKSKNRSKSIAHRQMSLMKAPGAEASTSH